MRVLFQLSALALRQVVGPGSDAALNSLSDRFSDRSSRLLEALKSANLQAWKAVEIALAGSSWWDRCKRAVASGDQYAFRGQVQAFLEAAPLEPMPEDAVEFRRKCLTELKAARREGLLPGEDIPDTSSLVKQTKALARFEDPKAVLDAEFDSIRKAGEALRDHGYENLACLVSLRPPKGRPLIVIAVEYFFRKDVLADPSLAAEFHFHELERLSERQEEGFRGLDLALKEQGDRLEKLLDSALDLLTETNAVARETRDDVHALRAELAQAREQDRESLAQMYQAMLKLLERVETAPVSLPRATPGAPVKPAPAPEPSEDAIAEMRNLVEQCGTMPGTEKRQHKALFRAVGRLKATVRSYDTKRRIRKNVMPSALFTGTPAQASPVQEQQDLPFAEPLDEPGSTPPLAAPPSSPPATVNSIFGPMPKPKIRRTKPGDSG